MKHYRLISLLLLVALVTLTATHTSAQRFATSNRVVVLDNNGKSDDPDRTPQEISDAEYQAAFNRLDHYLESQHIAPADIATYNLTDDNYLTLKFRSQRPDTAFQIPPEVDFPPYLVSDYSASCLARSDKELEQAGVALSRADKQLERANQQAERQMARAEKQIKRANKQLRLADLRFQRSKRRLSQVNTFSMPDSGDYRVVTVNSTDTPTTVKTITINKLSDGNVKVSVNNNETKKSSSDNDDDDDDDDDDEWDDEWDDEDYRKIAKAIKSVTTYRDRNFRGHWAGFEVGFNWLLSPSGSLALSGEQEPLRMNLGTSFNFNLNFIQYSVPLWSSNFGVLTGLGFNFNNYRFKNKNTMVTGEHSISFNTDLQDAGHKVRSSRFFNWALTAPLLLELQSKGNGFRRVYISTGVLLNVRLHSSTKLLYDKNREAYTSDTFNLNDISFAPTLRLGIGCVRLYANFYPMGLFEKGRGPEVFPIETGLVLIPF